MRGRFHQMALILMCLLLACSLGAGAEQAFLTLPLDTFQGGPAPGMSITCPTPCMRMIPSGWRFFRPRG